MVEDVRLRARLALAAHEVLEDRELAGRELDLLAAPEAAPGGRVESEVAGHEHRRPLPASPADEGPEVGDEDDEAEGLGQEVVRSRVQRLGVVVVTGLGRQHEDGRPDALVPQLGAHPVAVDAGQEDVEDDGVVAAGPGQVEALPAVGGHVDGEALPGQPPAQDGTEALLVLHHQHPHGPHGATFPAPQRGEMGWAAGSHRFVVE
jgi:hypothetical protein